MSLSGFCRSVLLAAPCLVVGAPGLAQTDRVAGDLITFTDTSAAPNGAWSWFEDERAIIDATDPDNRLVLISSVSSAPNGDPESGDIDLLWMNLDTGQKGAFELHNRLERDDHNSAALYMRPDGRYVAMYSKHGMDTLNRWRVSVRPHDPTDWGPEQTLHAGAGATYNNLHHLPDDDNGAGRTYNFTRAVNYDPIVQTSSDHGSTWANAGKLLTQGSASDRPYLKYASDGDAIHFIATEEHPHDFQNSVYHGYVKDGKLYDSFGTLRDADLFDASGVSPTALTTVLANGTELGCAAMTRAWTIDLTLDGNGKPVGVLSARADGNIHDHRFLYARHDGADWHVHPLAKAGGYLYSGQWDYTGLVAIDPDDPNVVYMSSEIDPRTDAPTDKYELYRGVTDDLGGTWTWTAITENSTVDNLRPVVPRWDSDHTMLLWMRGNYNSYTDWDTEIVGLMLVPEASSLGLLSMMLAVFAGRRRHGPKAGRPWR